MTLSIHKTWKSVAENVVRVTIINKKFESSLASAVERPIDAKLQIDKFGCTALNITAQPPRPMVQTMKKGSWIS